MRLAALVCSGALSFTASAQTYFYVDAINVQPTNPTTVDAITVDLVGNFSGGGVYVVNTNVSVVGNLVSITVNCADNGGITVLIPHMETIPIGQLAAGNYTIQLGGTGMGDFAPTPEHQFTVTGTGACDSLLINSISWDPFGDTAIVLSASNNSATLFDYPGFILFDDQGDTLAKETVNYFGISQGPQTHYLIVQPGATIPAGPFAGSLELWTLFYQSLGCTWDTTFSLCPPPPCAPLTVSLGNFGGAMVTASFTYSITDPNAVTVASGTISLDALHQEMNDTICLPPGEYTLSMVQPNMVGGALIYGLGTSYGPGPSEPFVQGGTTNTLPFSFYPSCYNGPNGLVEVEPGADLQSTLNNGLLTVLALDGRPLGPLSVFDGQGRLVATTAATTKVFTLDVSALSPGLLLVQRTGNAGQRSVVRVMNVR